MINLLLLCSCVGAPWLNSAHRQPGTDWWHDMGGTWDTSNHLANNNQYYKMYRQSSAQVDKHGYAQHVGKINRGQFLSRELNMPRHRAFGYLSDFNPEDLRSGSFNYKPQGPIFRAAAVHVNLGLANHVGEVLAMPQGQHVQADGSVLVQTSPWLRSPCHPDPCKHLAFLTCTPVNDGTAKCSENGKVQLILTAFDLSDNDDPMIVSGLGIAPEYHDGSDCLTDYCGFDWDNSDNYDYYDDNDSDGSRVIVTLAKFPDGSNYRDYTYTVAAIVFPDNASTSRTKLRVTLDGKDRQVLAVPQWDGSTNVNYDGRYYYFFGCFRPQTGFVDTRGAGFIDNVGSEVFGGFALGDPGLCKALLGWTGVPGFNPYEGSGTGPPQVPGWP